MDAITAQPLHANHIVCYYSLIGMTGAPKVCATPVGESVSCRSMKSPGLLFLKPANETLSRLLGRVRRSIEFDSQEPRRDMP